MGSMKVLQHIIIAIDGFSSCGKSTFARSIAQMLHYLYIDSGAMYRAFTWYCMENGIINRHAVQKDRLKDALEAINIHFEKGATGEYNIYVNNQNAEAFIRSVEVSDQVSVLSSEPLVRQKMIKLQQQLGQQKGVVMDGRDIGTVVFPQAELKIFMAADAGIRAQRRYNELLAKGIGVDFDEIKANIEQRDHLDLTRDMSPLVKADDALELDNSHLTVTQQMEWITNILLEKKIIRM